MYHSSSSPPTPTLQPNTHSFLPARPEKNLIEGRRMTDGFVEARRAAVERYLNRLAAHPAASRSEVRGRAGREAVSEAGREGVSMSEQEGHSTQQQQPDTHPVCLITNPSGTSASRLLPCWRCGPCLHSRATLNGQAADIKPTSPIALPHLCLSFLLPHTTTTLQVLRVFLEADGNLRSNPQWRALKPKVLTTTQVRSGPSAAALS